MMKIIYLQIIVKKQGHLNDLQASRNTLLSYKFKSYRILHNILHTIWLVKIGVTKIIRFLEHSSRKCPFYSPYLGKVPPASTALYPPSDEFFFNVLVLLCGYRLSGGKFGCSILVGDDTRGLVIGKLRRILLAQRMSLLLYAGTNIIINKAVHKWWNKTALCVYNFYC